MEKGKKETILKKKREFARDTWIDWAIRLFTIKDLILSKKPQSMNDLIKLLKNRGIKKSASTLKRDLEKLREIGFNYYYDKTQKCMNIGILIDESVPGFGNQLANLTAKTIELSEILRKEISDQKQMTLEFTEGKSLHVKTFFELHKYAQSKQVVSFNYQPVDREKKKVTILPRMVAERNNRLYCIGYRFDKERHQAFLVDRIEGSIFIESNIQFLRNASSHIPVFSKNAWFDQIIGISNEDAELLEIELLFTPKQALYMREYPFHTKKEEVMYDDDRGRCIRVKLKNTYELRAKILELGEGVEVLGPESLRIKIKETIANILKKYES